MASHKAAFDAWEVERLVILVVIIFGAEVFIPVAGHILLEESYKVFEEFEADDDELDVTFRCRVFYAYLELYNCLIHSILQSFSEGQKFVRGGQTGDCFFAKKPIKSAKTHFFRIFSIFAFCCMVKWPLIGAEIAPPIVVKFSGLV